MGEDNWQMCFFEQRMRSGCVRMRSTEMYFEDFTIGQKFSTRSFTLTEEEILDFAGKYDPQPFHIDRQAARDSLYGGLIASGFQTMGLCFRLFCQEGFLSNNLGSPGIDNVRWLAPVRAMDTLKTEVEILDIQPSSSKNDRGRIKMYYRAVNQDGSTVLTMNIIHIIKRRPACDQTG